jgi:hypothetical protein
MGHTGHFSPHLRQILSNYTLKRRVFASEGCSDKLSNESTIIKIINQPAVFDSRLFDIFTVEIPPGIY